MRKVLRAFVGTALSLCLVSALALAAAPSSSKSAPITVGKFAIELTRAMNLKVSGGLTADSAKKALSDLGISTSPADASLTEGELVRVLGQLGINVRTSDPLNEWKRKKVLRCIPNQFSRFERNAFRKS
jgi:hypothetical protein